MKWLGLIIVVLAAWFLSVVWEDPVEGKVARPVALLGIVGGIFMVLEGLKREIVRAVREKDEAAKN